MVPYGDCVIHFLGFLVFGFRVLRFGFMADLGLSRGVGFRKHRSWVEGMRGL